MVDRVAALMLLLLGVPPSAAAAGAVAGRVGAAPAGAAAAPLLRVAVSIPPQAWLVERIGGARVAIEVMIPPGVEEETYEPTPQQLLALARARVYVAIGHPAVALETRYVLPFVRRQAATEVVDMGAGIKFLELPAGGVLRTPLAGRGTQGDRAGRTPLAGRGAQGDRAEHRPLAGPGDQRDRAGTDPHIWIAPYTVAIAAANIARGLAQADPAGGDLYRANLAALLAEVRAADAEMRRVVAGRPGLEFIAYHPAWGYLAHQYGLVQIPVEVGGKEPGAASLAALAERARRDHVDLVLAPAGYTPKGAEMVAHAIGGRVVTVDYMSRDWPGMMRRLEAAFAQAGRGPVERR
jgi:zinc transport system substrate-binding protein